MTKKNNVKRVAKALRNNDNFKGLSFVDSFKLAKRFVNHYGHFNPLSFYDFRHLGFDVRYNSRDVYVDDDGYYWTTKADAVVRTDWGCTFSYTFG